MANSSIGMALACLAAIIVAAWFGLGEIQAHDTSVATGIANSQSQLTPAEAAHANSLLDTAATLNPDTQVELLRSRLAFEFSQKVKARRLAVEATHDEPSNPEAWLQLIRVTIGPKVLPELARLSRLVPHVPPPP